MSTSSRAAWLRDAPSDWYVSPLGTHFIERKETVSDKDYRALSVTKGGVVPQLATAAKTDNNDNRKLVVESDFVINSRSDRKGSSGISPFTGSVSVVYTVLELKDSIAPQFAHHLLRSSAFQEEYYRWGSGIVADLWSTRFSAMKQIPIALPPVSTQHAIADYLDRETAKIDTLVQEQQRLIDLLRERRQAVIDAAIGELDAPHGQLRRAVEFLTSGSRGWGEYYADEGSRFLRIGNLPRQTLQIRGEVQRIALPDGVTEGERTRLQVDDLLFSITAYLGSVAVVDSDWAGGYVSQHVALCRLRNDLLDSQFAGWSMLSTHGQDQLKIGAVGGTKVQLALDDIRELIVPFPPIEEQRRVAKLLTRQIERIDDLIVDAERFIELSKERRAALITAAVTGQIDVSEAA